MDRFRWLSLRLASSTDRRVVVLTGARQTGKTTLARRVYGDLPYFSLDDAEVREALRAIRSRRWGSEVGAAVLDEAQKEPALFDKVKLSFDQREIDFTVLLGSSRFLLLDQIRESLAGRAFVYDLWPLMPSEIRTPETDEPIRPLLDCLLSGAEPPSVVLDAEPEVLIGAEDDARRSAIDHLSRWGGMPELLRLGDEDRKEWLRSYQHTFLERDLSDLARLADLQPFTKLQRLAMLRSASILSFSELGRDAGIGATTARRYLEYLRLSYQVFLLPPYARNLTSSTVKTPKLYWMDLGILRQQTLQLGPLTGPLFETLVVGEVRKWIDTVGADCEMTFYRTHSGLEVDLILRTPRGVIGVEVKRREQADRKDTRGLRAIADALGDEWLCGLVVTTGTAVRRIDKEHAIYSCPVHRLL